MGKLRLKQKQQVQFVLLPVDMLNAEMATACCQLLRFFKQWLELLTVCTVPACHLPHYKLAVTSYCDMRSTHLLNSVLQRQSHTAGQQGTNKGLGYRVNLSVSRSAECNQEQLQGGRCSLWGGQVVVPQIACSAGPSSCAQAQKLACCAACNKHNAGAKSAGMR